jgi:Tfp pilus assembly protein PilO
MTSLDFMRFLAWLRRHPFCVTCTSVALVMAVTSWFLWQKVQSLDEERTTLAKEGEYMLATRASGTTLRPDLAYVREYTRRIEDNLVVADALIDNKGYFYKIEKQARVSLNDVQQLPAQPPDTGSQYRSIPFSLKVTGGYDQLAAFLRAIETGPRLANITAFSFRRSASLNLPDAPSAALLTLDLNVELLGKL